jgi:hypothetical protein
MTIGFYRYVSYPAEIAQLLRERKVHSTNPGTGYATWYTPTRYDVLTTACAELALPAPPTHRVGPIPATGMPAFDIQLRAVAPAFGQPGGGVEARTRAPVWVFGVWDFHGNKWDL